MSRFPSRGADAALVGLGSLANSLSPTNVARNFAAVNQLEEQRIQREAFTGLLAQHNADVQNDPEYRKFSTALAKRNPSAFMDARNLAELRADVGAVKSNLQMVNDLQTRIDTFAGTPQGQASGFNPEFERFELKRISKLIQDDPQVGNQALFQKMNILSAAMQQGQSSFLQNQFLQERQGEPAAQILGQLTGEDGAQLPPEVRSNLQRFLLGQLQGEAAAGRAEGEAAPSEIVLEIEGSAAQVQTDEERDEIVSNVGLLLKANVIDSKQADRIISRAEGARATALATEGQVQEDRIDEAGARNFIQNLIDEDVDTSDPLAIMDAVRDSEDLQEVMKLSGIEDLAQLDVAIRDQNNVLGGLLTEAQGIEIENLDSQVSFVEGGGVDKFAGKQTLTRSNEIPGKLNVTTGDDSSIPTFRKVPPMRTLEEGFFSDDVGLIGATDIGIITKGGVGVPVMSSVNVEGVPEGTQIGFIFRDASSQPQFVQFPDGANAAPVIFDAADYASKNVVKLENDSGGEAQDLINGSLKEFEKSLRSTAAKEKDKDKKQQINAIRGRVGNILNTLSFSEDVDVGFGGGAPGSVEVRSLKDLPKDSPERHQVLTTAVLNMMIEYNRLNAVIHNSFTGRFSEDGNP